MADESPSSRRTWRCKFGDAFRGVARVARSESSFHVHLAALFAVVVVGLSLGVSRLEWCVLALCVTGVLVAEAFNTAIEQLAKAIDRRDNVHLRDALDIAAGAVALASGGALTVGVLVLGYRAAVAWGWFAGG